MRNRLQGSVFLKQFCFSFDLSSRLYIIKRNEITTIVGKQSNEIKIDWLIDWLKCWLIDWLIDWLIGWYFILPGIYIWYMLSKTYHKILRELLYIKTLATNLALRVFTFVPNQVNGACSSPGLSDHFSYFRPIENGGDICRANRDTKFDCLWESKITKKEIQISKRCRLSE